LVKADRPRVVFDFSSVGELDSTGVKALLVCLEEVLKRNGDLKLAAIPPEPAVVLEVTGVDRLFEIFENSSDAVESFNRSLVHEFQAGPQSLDRGDISGSEGIV
jgi:anti-anti-sigma regulatory factor